MAALSQTPTEFLYHYTKRRTALEHILGHFELRMGDYSNTNDPREAKQWAPFGAEGGRLGEFRDGATEGWDEIERVQQATKLLCLTMDAPAQGLEVPVEERGFGLSRMWAQSAESHSGVCLGLDSSALDESIHAVVPSSSNLIFGQMHYGILSEEYRNDDMSAFWLSVDRIQRVGAATAILEHVRTHAQTFYFKKALDWRDEREFRWVYIGDENTPQICVPIRRALHEVVLGVNFPMEFIPEVEAICRSEGIHLKWMHLYRGHFIEPEVIV